MTTREIQCNRERCGYRVCEGYNNLVCPYCLEPFKRPDTSAVTSTALEAIIRKYCADCDGCELPRELRKWHASEGSCEGCKFENRTVPGYKEVCLVCSRKRADNFERIDT